MTRKQFKTVPIGTQMISSLNTKVTVLGHTPEGIRLNIITAKGRIDIVPYSFHKHWRVDYKIPVCI